MINNISIGLSKVGILMAFCAPFYYITTNTDNVDSIFDTIGILLSTCLVALGIIFSVIQMTGLSYLNFKSAEFRNDPSKTWNISRFFWWALPTLHLFYNIVFPLIWAFVGYFDSENWIFSAIPSLKDIILTNEGFGDFANKFGGWILYCLRMLLSPIQNFENNFSGLFGLFGGFFNRIYSLFPELSFLPDWIRRVTVTKIILFVLSLFSVFFNYTFRKNTQDNDKTDDNNPIYKILIPLQKIYYGLGDSHIKILFPWQDGWDDLKTSEKTWGGIVLGGICIITLIGEYNMYVNNQELINIFNNDVGDGTSILALINVLLLIALFGINLYNFIYDYGSHWNCKGDKKNESPETTSKLTWIIIIIFLIYFAITCFMMWRSSENINNNLISNCFLLIATMVFGIFVQGNIVNSKKKVCGGSAISNWAKFIIGISGSWLWLICLIAICINLIFGLFSGKYTLQTIGIIPLINNLMRTVMLFIANIIGFMPYWLGGMNFAKL